MLFITALENELVTKNFLGLIMCGGVGRKGTNWTADWIEVNLWLGIVIAICFRSECYRMTILKFICKAAK